MNRAPAASTAPPTRESGGQGETGPAGDRPAPDGEYGGRTILLVGLMGAGKSTVGRRLAVRLGRPFLDADTEIEKAAGQTIPEIFEQFGEAHFRAGERRVIARLLSVDGQVLATGGGAFMDAETRANAAERAITIWLKADLDTLVKRCARRNERPLLQQGDPRETLAGLMEKRHPFYAEADLTVESTGESHDVVVDKIITALNATYGPNSDRTS